MAREKVVVVMGSGKDAEFVEPMLNVLEELQINYEQKVASAHKTPRKALKILDENKEEDKLVYITVAGRSNALSGFIDANTKSPVIACPPISDNFGGADIFSSLRMPSGVCPLVVLEPKNAALAAAKILSIGNEELSGKISDYQASMRKKVEESDERVGE